MNPKGHKWGVWNAVCDVCGRQYKSDEMKERWDGAMVCADDFETQHPMDFQKIPRTEQPIPWSRNAKEYHPDDITYADAGQDDIPSGTFNTTDPIGSDHGVS